jgi:hypothetical protein
MIEEAETVHALWVKAPLSALEWLTIHSFIRQGFRFVLWTYDLANMQFEVPGLTVSDAGQIIPSEQVFAYEANNPLGIGKGSFAGFSDIFRYRLLFEKGGWWTDMDVTCLKKPMLSEPYLFRRRKANEEMIVGNIMKVPVHSELMKRCYERARVLNAKNQDWEAPIRILNEEINNLGLNQFSKVFSNDDSWPVISNLVSSRRKDIGQWHFIHWMNEEFRALNISKERFPEAGWLGQLLRGYHLNTVKMTLRQSITFRWKTNMAHYFLTHARKGSFRTVSGLAIKFVSRKLLG